MHLGAKEGGAAETFPCVPVTTPLGISCHTHSLHCDSLGCFVPAVLWQHPGWWEPQFTEVGVLGVQHCLLTLGLSPNLWGGWWTK